MKDKLINAMAMATIACWDCGDRGYDYTCGFAKTDNENIFIVISIFNGCVMIIDYIIYIDNPYFSKMGW